MEKMVRKKWLDFLQETHMSRHEFSKRSGIPRSTLRSMEQKEDYDIGEGNMLKLCQGMNIQPFELFLTEVPTFAVERTEVLLLTAYRKLDELDQCRLEGYLHALSESHGGTGTEDSAC